MILEFIVLFIVVNVGGLVTICVLGGSKAKCKRNNTK